MTFFGEQIFVEDQLFYVPKKLNFGVSSRISNHNAKDPGKSKSNVCLFLTVAFCRHNFYSLLVEIVGDQNPMILSCSSKVVIQEPISLVFTV